MYSHLIREQRYAIFALKQKGKSNAEIARTIKVSLSTVSRELRRNLTPRGKYIWNKAQVMADARKHRSPGNRAIADTLRWRVEQYILQEQWSPYRFKIEVQRLYLESIQRTETVPIMAWSPFYGLFMDCNLF